MKTFSFYKLTGAGNDFILFDLKDNPKLDIMPDFVRNICSRPFGIGADGVIVFADSDTFDFKVSFYNADGTTGVLCGNGARCAIRYAGHSGRLKNKSTRFEFNGKNYSGEILPDDSVKFDMNFPVETRRELNVFAAGQIIKGTYVNTGSPHFVININDVNKGNGSSSFVDIKELPALEIGKEIRYSDAFAPEGVNVNFISVNSDPLKIRTYERGVEGETLACGTGSAASAIVAVLNYNAVRPVRLLTAGGDILSVDFSLVGDAVNDVTLTGPAKIVFKGEITI
jgi:diaminopimelate epimerase